MTAIVDLLRVLVEPEAVFERVRQKPSLLWPFLALVVSAFLIDLLRLPFERAATAAMISQSGAALGRGPSDTSYVFVALIRTIGGLSVSVAFSAAFFWVALTLSGTETSLRTLLVVATYAGAVRVLLATAILIILVIRGLGSVTSTADLAPSLGLDLLLPQGAGVVAGVQCALRELNVFSLWGVFLTGLGVKVTHRLHHSWSYLAAALAFGLALLYHCIVAPELGQATLMHQTIVH